MLSTEKPIGNGAFCARGADRPLNKQNRRGGRPAVWRLAIGARLAAQLAEVVNFHDTLPFFSTNPQYQNGSRYRKAWTCADAQAVALKRFAMENRLQASLCCR